MNAFNADGRWKKCPYPECPNWVDTSTEVPAKLLTISVPSIPVPSEISWYACEQHKDQVKDAKFDVQLEFQKHVPSFTRSFTNELQLLLGYIYRKPLEPSQRDIEEGIARWTKNLTEKQADGNGAKLEVALLNALARFGIPSFFTGSAAYGGNETPVFDLVALGFFQYHHPTAVLISCKNSRNQPSLGDIGKLSDETYRVRQLLPGWVVFGTLALTGEPTADEFGYRKDIRILKQSHLKAILNAHAREQIDHLLWTQPSNWNRTSEMLWRSMYDAFPKV